MASPESLTGKVAAWLPRLAPLLAIALGLAVNLMALDMAAEVFMVVLMLVMFLGLVECGVGTSQAERVNMSHILVKMGIAKTLFIK
jgi:hypothetical protein